MKIIEHIGMFTDMSEIIIFTVVGVAFASSWIGLAIYLAERDRKRNIKNGD